jgi:hypothetical protein
VTVPRDNVPVPSAFETSRLRALRAANRAESERREARLSELRVADYQYCAAEVERHIEKSYTTEGFARMVESQKQELLGSKKRDFTRWRAEQFEEYPAAHVRRRVSRDVTVPTFQE